jgi:two-component system response regulator HydG
MTQNQRTRILVVDDSEEICRTLKKYLERRGCKVRTFTAPESAQEGLKAETADILLVDYFVGEATSTDLVKWAVDNERAHMAVCMTGSANAETIMNAREAGCGDVLEKPLDLKYLDEVVRARIDGDTLDLDSWRQTYAPDLIGEHGSLLEPLEIVKSVATTDATVLITGETGTGKELVAHAVHIASERREKPFVAINCASIPDSLIESELFGHAKGAFTGAQTDREGRILSANGGTLFLDEIGDMPLAAQAKLLRVLQDRVVQPVGSDRSIPFDARIVAATNRDLDAMVEQGTFRADLLFRLSVVNVHLPALRERGDDVLLLANHFLSQANRRNGRSVVGFDESAVNALRMNPWPGNVRDLANTIERAVLIKRTGMLAERDLLARRAQKRAPSTPIATPPSPAVPENLNLREALDRLEKDLIERALQKTEGNRTEAAALLGLNRTTLVEKLRKTSGT